MSGLLFALAFALVAIHGLRSRQLAGKLRRDVRHLAQNVDMLETAEGLAGYGRWCIELDPRRHLWSEEMCHLASLPAGTAPREEILERILPDGLAQIETTLMAHKHDHEAFAIEFEVVDRNGNSRILRARARNLFSPEGVREQVFMVVRDVTGDYSLKRDRDEALERAARAQQQANTDELTGLANRRSAMAFLDRAVVEARKCGDPLSVVVFDIDHFKAVNDGHGHLTGDKVIRTLGEIAARQARELDLVGRVGGEEFIWIMPGCAADVAFRVAERLRWAVEAGTHSASIPSITISAGHAELEPGDASLMLFARADAALYEAKRAGRNRVTKAA
ncbi:sensor domain-containing diguanylate cyclase [Qipengyuania xiapuensis]|uniref:diguanylate cyclase n=1 Tax=Qipengyuania xiapuensis TaxID=2867236 RepID=A0ABX8ZTV9_9SPHN|nr:sensor domain-containing diguanylate cyclase [Qipengyuania xiapuensis]QZD92349.1 sensor domain-containing diguanylate cyclase [Qipengyuania xiapuensis]